MLSINRRSSASTSQKTILTKVLVFSMCSRLLPGILERNVQDPPAEQMGSARVSPGWRSWKAEVDTS
jgi:hypothetical protein